MTSRYIGNELELFAHARNWKAYWASHLRPYLGRHILDVGAGIGGTARLISDFPFESYLALEPDTKLAVRIESELASDRLRVLAGTTADLPQHSRFDTALYIDVLEHIEHDREELSRVSRLLSPGGRILVLAPAHQSLYSPFDAAVGHVRRYNEKSLVAAKPDGLFVERVFYLDSVGLLASWANRVLLKASLPTMAQIRLWDRVMVPTSRVVDPLVGFKLGKTVVAVFKDPN